MTVNVTTLLVLTTLFISISDALPRTSYVKMMDIWLIFNLMIPFLEIILQTMIHKLHDEDDFGNEVMSYSSPVGTTNKNINGLVGTRTAREDGSRQEMNKFLKNILEILALVVLPGLYIIFCIIFFIIGNLAF